MSKPACYPLLFTYKDCISGNGFLANVTVSGRALMLEEDDGQWWMYGVQPVAIADTGDTPEGASTHFRDRYKTVLFDFASDALDFNGFKQEVDRFFHQTEDEIANDWQEAFEAIRSGKVEPEKPFSSLPRHAPETWVPEIAVQKVRPSAVSPDDNALDKYRIPYQIAV